MSEENTTLKTPDITPMQLIVGAVSGVITAVLGLITAFDWTDLTLEQSGAILGVWAALGSVGVIADAIIRNGRARALSTPTSPPIQTEEKIAG